MWRELAIRGVKVKLHSFSNLEVNFNFILRSLSSPLESSDITALRQGWAFRWFGRGGVEK
jgi:hypothetical protein